jgi:hypothetical protein
MGGEQSRCWVCFLFYTCCGVGYLSMVKDEWTAQRFFGQQQKVELLPVYRHTPCKPLYFGK